MSIETLSETNCFGGRIGFYRHASAVNHCDMRFSVFVPPQAAAGEVPVGAVVVAGNEIVATAHNRSITDSDPSGHAEVLALRAAAGEIGNHRLAAGEALEFVKHASEKG